jgi:hypothetical protein
MENTSESFVISELHKLAFYYTDLNIRYQYIASDRMHLVEVDPPEFYGFEEIEQFENQLSALVSNLDLTQVVLFITKHDVDFCIENPSLVIAATKPEILPTWLYMNNEANNFQANDSTNSNFIPEEESNFALAA